MSRSIYILIGILCLIAGAAVAVYLLQPQQKNNLPDAEKPDGQQQTQDTAMSIYETEQYDTARTMLDSGEDLDQALQIFKELEAKTTMPEDLAHLQLKQLQVLLAKEALDTAADQLVEIVTNPLFPNVVKARAMENVLMQYISTGYDRALFEAVFSQAPFDEFQEPRLQDAWLNYLNYAYELHPTTIVGARIILIHFDKLSNYNADELAMDKQELSEFIDQYIRDSKRETESLSALDHQETHLVSAYTDRAYVVSQAKERGIDVTETYEPVEDYVRAIEAGTDSGSPFYRFYAVYNYIDYVYISDVGFDERLESVVADESIFDSSLISKQEFELVAGPVGDLSSDEISFMAETNPALGSLIEQYR